jgi:hypothetical protein
MLGPTHVVSGTRQVADVLGEVLQVQGPVGLPVWQERKQATSPQGLMACLVFVGRAIWRRCYSPWPLRLPSSQADCPNRGNPGQQGKAARLGHRLFATALAPVGGEDGGVVDVVVAVGRRRDGPFRPGRSTWHERKQATSPRGARGLVGVRLRPCLLAAVLLPAAATPFAAASTPSPLRQSQPTGQGCPARAPTRHPCPRPSGRRGWPRQRRSRCRRR